MDISGQLQNNQIYVRKSHDIGRIFTKSHIGTLVGPNLLQLSLLEGVFLLDEQKITIFQGKRRVHFSELLKLAVQEISEFETKYLVFKDLRTRGHAVTLLDNSSVVAFKKYKTRNTPDPSCVIAAFSERDLLDIDIIQGLIEKYTTMNSILWFALVDEEGDITYYSVSPVDLQGHIPEQQYPLGSCVLLKNRLIVFDKKLGELLLKNEFFGKPFGELLQLSFVEGLYLLENNVVEIFTTDGKKLSKAQCIRLMQKHQPDIVERLLVFRDLKQRGLLVKTGFKFGSHFRAYTKQPDKTHAEYLVHVVEKGFTSIWAEISRAVRLAHSVNKEFIFACVDRTSIEYIKLGRLRP
jgi:tRNA-intron endonuclease